ASPLARKLAADKNINLAQVKGTGPGGRIIKRDIEAFQQKAPSRGVIHTLSQSVTRTPMSEIRKVIARRITESKQTRPHFYLRVGVDMTTILEARNSLNAQQDEKVSLNAFLLKFAAEALKKNPNINVSMEGQEILTYAHADIGIAVALTDGLITPVVRDCGAKSIRQIDSELKDLISRAREKKLEPHEFTNSTFTISNLGSFGIDEFTAIINPPDSAILAVGTIKKIPGVNNKDEIVVLPVSQFTLSCDHRVIDGAVGARFLHDLKTLMENPASAFY
ncbi:MAG: 2-oxo acid dehydrogenase subunit E2, partial [Spirochaetales bacterium]|nr:2-oxo acid dehydrogenase subunit E2 [Spirochaetales bacterium]